MGSNMNFDFIAIKLLIALRFNYWFNSHKALKMRAFSVRAFVVLAFLLLLTACGGGGGSPASSSTGGGTITPPTTTCSNGALDYPTCTPPAPAATGMVSGVTCNPAVGASTCTGTVTHSITGATTPRLMKGATYASSTLLSSATSATAVSYTLSMGANVFTVYDGATPLASYTLTVVCAAGTTADSGGNCQTNVLHYTDKVVAMWTHGYPYLVTKTTVTAVTNSTSYTIGAIPLSSCGVTSPSYVDASSGQIPFECTAAFGVGRVKVQLNPNTGVLTNYTGTLPSGTGFILAESPATNLPVAFTTSAHVSDGYFYRDSAAGWNLLFRLDATGVDSTVKAGTFATDGTIGVIRAYTN